VSETDKQAQPLRVALLGCGVVGSAVARLLTENSPDLSARVGRRLEIIGVAVRRPDKDRSGTGVDASLFTTDAAGLVARADVVIEVIGGIEPARSLILAAMKNGASVVTANKSLLAEDGPRLYQAAQDCDVDLYYEASVAGAIPLLRPLRESLVGDDVHRILGIVNGTTNYVLDKMDTTGAGFADAVEQAQALGYAEADPTADVEGFDAAAKAAILASLAFHTRVSAKDVYREGITEISAADIKAAREMDCVVKLLAICERIQGDGVDSKGSRAGGDPDGGGISVRVHPAMIPRSHPLAGVREAFNAVFVEAVSAGSLMFYGRGAGQLPTASAIVGDIIDLAMHQAKGGTSPRMNFGSLKKTVVPMGEVKTQFYLRLDVKDQPGVLASITKVFGDCGVSISAVTQKEATGESVELVIFTHGVTEADFQRAVTGIRELPVVVGVQSLIRVHV